MEQLTGRYYHKQTWFGLMLMVEYKKDRGHFADTFHWRKATNEDLVNLGEKLFQLDRSMVVESRHLKFVNEIRKKYNLEPIGKISY